MVGCTSSYKLPGCHCLQTPAGSTTAVTMPWPAASRPRIDNCFHAQFLSYGFQTVAMCEDDSSSIRSWSELPVSVLAFAFEKVDLRYRMNCIALVCTSWAEAAAAATSSIELSRCTNTDSLQQWLRSRGSHVIEIILLSADGVINSLPCPRLEWLVLENTRVDLHPGSQLLQDLSAATTLQHLHLNGVVFQGDL